MSPSIVPLLDHVTPFLLVVSRLAGLFLSAPALSSRSIPRRAKALLAVMLAASVYPSLPASARVAPEVDLVGLAALLAIESLIGACVGLIASIPLMAVQLAGHVMSHQMGLAIASTFNPETDADSTVLSDLLVFTSMAAFLAVGGIEILYSVMLDSFGRVPVGSFSVGMLPLDLLVGTVGSGMEVALRLSTPVLAIVMLAMIAMGAVMKTLPQINILSVGFAIKILVGIGMLAVALGVINTVLREETASVLDTIWEWGLSLGTGDETGVTSGG